jgi:hypothetical protein
MVRIAVETMLGGVGREILYFYEAHAFIINLFVLAYGFILFFAWSNLVKIHRYLVIAIAKQIHTRGDLDKDSSPKKVLKKVHIPWDEAMKKSRFPFVAKMSGLWPKRKSVSVLKDILIAEDLAAHALAVNNGANIRKISPNTKHMYEKQFKDIQKKNRKETTEK